MLRIDTAAFVAVLLCASLSACGSSAPPRPKNPVMAAALAQTSVHWETTDTETSEGTTEETADVTADSGTALIDWYFEDQGGKLHLVLVDDVLYARGDADSLESYLGLTPAQAKRYVGRWISTTPAGEPQLAQDLTLAGVVRKWASRVERRRAGAEPLPIDFGEQVASDESIYGTFSKWNEPLHVEAPSGSVPIADVRAS